MDNDSREAITSDTFLYITSLLAIIQPGTLFVFVYFFFRKEWKKKKKKRLGRNLYFHTPALLTSSTLGSDFNLWGMHREWDVFIPPFRRLMRPPTRSVSGSQLTTQPVQWRLWIGVGVSPVCLPIRHWMQCLVRRNVSPFQNYHPICIPETDLEKKAKFAEEVCQWIVSSGLRRMLNK